MTGTCLALVTGELVIAVAPAGWQSPRIGCFTRSGYDGRPQDRWVRLRGIAGQIQIGILINITADSPHTQGFPDCRIADEGLKRDRGLVF